MLQHIVMWKLKENALGKSKSENAQIMKERLEGLLGVIPQLKEAHVGININKTDSSAYDAVLISTFESFEDLEKYKIDPRHVEISTFCKQIRESRVVVDY